MIGVAGFHNAVIIVQRLEHAVALVEAKLFLARLFIRAVALEAAVGEQGTNLKIIIHLPRFGGGQTHGQPEKQSEGDNVSQHVMAMINGHHTTSLREKITPVYCQNTPVYCQ